ncbi:hypothetical protein ACEQ8H_002539 [Pleosporales sp. CAS-2024a]
MARPRSSSSGTEYASPKPQSRPSPTPIKSTSVASAPPSPKSPRNPANRMWIHEERKRIFLHHLTQWTLNHDSSLHFQGKISVSSQATRDAEGLGLGKPVKCILTDSHYTDARQIIVVKLFPPSAYAADWECNDEATRRDSMEPFDSMPKSHQPLLRAIEIAEVKQHLAGNIRAHYRLVVRCGAGWMSARDYFSRLYVSRLESARGQWVEHDEHLRHQSRALGPAMVDDDSVTVRPLFHAFKKLPPELQDMVLMMAASLRRSCDLRSDDYGTLVQPTKDRAVISLSTLFRISKSITERLQLYIYHRTDFHFGLTGFTNFLWQSGPEKRHEIRRLTFHFGKLALLHCIRWLAPDSVFMLFEPPVATNPRSLQYFWRCQIQDLVKDLHLFTLTINIRHIAKSELPMMVAVIQSAFGSIKQLRFVETDSHGTTKPLDLNDERLSGLRRKHTWREMCLDYFQTHRTHSYFFKFELLKAQAEDLEAIMAKESYFYNTAFSPLAPRNEYPVVLE